MRFVKPKNIVSNFDQYLESDICQSYNLIKNWYSSTPVGSTPVLINAELTKVKNSNVYNFKVSKNTDLDKGDYIFDDVKNIYYLCHENVFESINSKITSLVMCNINIHITRDIPEIVDNQGISSTPASTLTVADDIYAFISKYGMVEFDNGFGKVGIFPKNEFVILLQANTSTLSIQVNDELNIWNENYRVINRDYSKLNIDNLTGIISLDIERKV